MNIEHDKRLFARMQKDIISIGDIIAIKPSELQAELMEMMKTPDSHYKTPFIVVDKSVKTNIFSGIEEIFYKVKSLYNGEYYSLICSPASDNDLSSIVELLG